MITKEDLKFVNLPSLAGNRVGIKNARLQIRDGFSLSVSKSDPYSSWYVGKDDSYNVAIMVASNGCESLVSHPDADGNIWSECDIEKINEIAKLVNDLEVGPDIWVLGDWGGPVRKEEWRQRFATAAGYDFNDKLKYVSRIFPKVRKIVHNK
jgi:hypothetical protein